MNEIIRHVAEAIIDGDRSTAVDLTQQALREDVDSETLLNEGMIGAMREVGLRFEREEYYVPEMLLAARAMQEALAILRPRLSASAARLRGKIVLGTVLGDLHDIGKNLVGMMLEGAGFEIVDLGTDVDPASFVGAVRDHSPDVLAMSALLTTTMPNMERTIRALQDAGVREKVRVVVGGAPLTATYARQIDADGYAPDASRAVRLVESLTGTRTTVE
jgi:5-methyltetrahydrofolate--homocysteine methyltransferase